MEKTIFKVIKILDSETLLLNAGKNDEINIGDKFEIYGPGKEIFDPDTKKSLGTLDIIKETVSADTVLDNMCVCRHHQESTLAAMISLSTLYVSNGNKILNVDKTQMSNELDEDHTIKIGDKARRILISKSEESTKN